MYKQANIKKPLLSLALILATLMSVVSIANSASSPFAQNDAVKFQKPIKESNAKCGEGKCGSAKTEEKAEETAKKCGEGKCGDEKPAASSNESESKNNKCGEGKSGDSKPKKSKCGEGKCG